jgi:S1-C subfamily serine protease
MVSRLVIPLAVVVALALGAPASVALTQIDPQVRDRVVPAIVEIAIDIDATENGSTESTYLPMGSGTMVSPDGLILTNHHVIDMAAHRAQFDAWEAQASQDGESLAFVLHDDHGLVLGTDGASVPEPVYTAEVVAEQHGPAEKTVNISLADDLFLRSNNWGRW